MFLSTVEVILILVYLFDTIFIETPSVCWLRNKPRVFFVFQSIFCVVCRDTFLSTAAVIIILFYFFDTIFIETTSVRWLRNQSSVFFISLIIRRIHGFIF